MSHRRLPTFLVALASVLASCSPPASAPAPTAAQSAPASETLAQRLTRLHEAARAESQLALYSSLNNEDAKVVLPKFEKAFPGVKVQHTRKTNDELVQAILTEKRAGRDLFDILDSGSFGVKFIIDQGYTQPYAVASMADYPADARDPNGAWIANRIVPLAIGFNTQKGVKPGDITGWADLCDKKYAGLAVEKNDVVVYSSMRKLYGDAEAQRILKCVAANKPSLRSSHTDIDNLLPAGEFAVTFASHTHRLANLKYEEKKPVDWVKTAIVNDLGIMTLAAKPPHPNAARLFMEWLTSPDGQAAIVATGRAPASTNVQPKYSDLLGERRLYVTIDMAKDFQADLDFWQKTFGLR